MSKLAIGVASREVIEVWVQHGVGRLYLAVVGGHLAVERVSDRKPHHEDGAETHVYLDSNGGSTFQAKLERERVVTDAVHNYERCGTL